MTTPLTRTHRRAWSARQPEPVATTPGHRPLMVFAAMMLALAVAAAVGLVVDQRVLVGAPIWAKPFKFAVSFTLYAVTWAWMIGQLPRFRRAAAWWAGTVIAVSGLAEMVLIVGQTVRGRQSHFNNATDFDAMVFKLMGITIGGLWIGSFVVAALLFVKGTDDRARTWAIRSAAALSLIGLLLGGLMLIPTQAQLDADSDILGAHSVGVPDGGAGLPLLGWSTTGGDLRIPHFVGMHALQVLPLLAIGLDLLARRRRNALLRSESTRLALVVIGATGYAGLIALVTWQALRGQSLVRPDALTLLVAAAGLVAVVAATGIVLRLAATRQRSATSGPATAGSTSPVMGS